MLVDVELPLHLPPGSRFRWTRWWIPELRTRVVRGAGRRRLRASRCPKRDGVWRTGGDPKRRSARLSEWLLLPPSGGLRKRLKSLAPVSRACAYDRQPAGTPGQVAAGKAVIDPNCGMPVDPAKAAASSNTLFLSRQYYYFCSKKWCKRKNIRTIPAGTASKQASGR